MYCETNFLMVYFLWLPVLTITDYLCSTHWSILTGGLSSFFGNSLQYFMMISSKTMCERGVCEIDLSDWTLVSQRANTYVNLHPSHHEVDFQSKVDRTADTVQSQESEFNHLHFHQPQTCQQVQYVSYQCLSCEAANKLGHLCFQLSLQQNTQQQPIFRQSYYPAVITITGSSVM